jgi:ketopantoate hydroxymethyltransferase
MAPNVATVVFDFCVVGDTMRAAFNAYDEAVKGGEFPSEKETFS